MATKTKTVTPATLLCDFYKVSHRPQYPDNTEVVYSTWTPRTSRIPGIGEVVAFGFQGFIKEYLIDYFKEHFFSRPQAEVVAEYVRYIKFALGEPNPDFRHIADLHDLGFLPVLIKAVPEGSSVPIRMPMLTIENTDPRFFWVTNYLETLISCSIWQPSTSATLAKAYRKILDAWAAKTSSMPGFVQFQGHDFSMRGMGALGAACTSGAGHLLSFTGTDTIPAIAYLEAYYGADIEHELVGCSIPATEHSVMCAGGADDEFGTYERLITKVYPTGFVSIVSDTWDLWHVLTDTIPKLKDKIMARDGKVVIRPDSGDPVDIICGNEVWTNQADYEKHKDLDGRAHPAIRGVIEILWETFGGTINDKGYKELDPHIGAIYGDAITLDRTEEICRRLAAKGFASTNIVLGIGSFTYQYNTRDTFGFALKSTHAKIDGVEHNIFKDPATDDGTKKSATGRVAVVPDPAAPGQLRLVDGLNITEEYNARHYNLLQPIFRDGVVWNEVTLQGVRNVIHPSVPTQI